MKRDMNLVREIMLQLRDFEHSYAPDIKVVGYSEEQIGFHSLLMYEAGLIDAVLDGSLALEHSADPRRLTWAGYEFIDNAQDPKVWGQAKEAVDKLGAVSFSVWASVLATLVGKNLGI
jgi:hypothetical protein